MKIVQTITPSHQNKIVKASLTVPENCRRIVITKDIKSSVADLFINKIDVTFFDPKNKWCGRFDRYKGELTIDGDSEYIGAIESGEWQLCYEVFQVYESVEITLNIRFEIRETYNTYIGELHSHTDYTDGKLSLQELSEHLKNKHRDFFFISDHNSIKAWEELKSLEGIKGYRGLELTTFSGHVLLLGLNHYIGWYGPDDHCKDLSKVREEVHSQGGLMGIAHPFANGGPLCAGCRWGRAIEADYLDFLEVWNSKGNNFRGNWEAIELWIEMLREDRRIFCTCGADVHKSSDLDEALTVHVLSARNEEQNILAALRLGRFYLSDEIEISLDINGKTFGQSLGLQSADKQPFSVNYKLNGGNENLQYFFITKDGMKPISEKTGVLKWQTEHQRDFFLILGMTSDRYLKLLTNPVFFEIDH
ncbi:MAG TPA: CehA/McbA family metallohydrolase [Thermotogota bacterium]|nr:CehA/McbA family metallohydrolase [Thermotogota bacterium]HPJ88586.1 CehA/McbA family metallohydrolase [Thermotogota bacterium]